MSNRLPYIVGLEACNIAVATYTIRKVKRVKTNRSLDEGTVGSSTSCRAVKVRG